MKKNLSVFGVTITMRLAVKISYDGSLFHGSQRQSGDDPGSVEGSVIRTLRKVSAIPTEGDPPVWFSSRTDSGVSALGNVMAVDTEMSPSELLCALNANLDGIWCLGYSLMRDQQNVRWADSRWYRYHLMPGMVPPDRARALDSALSLFVGQHDFRHFCRNDDGKDTVTTIESARSEQLGGGLFSVDIVGYRFLWNQVRRMVGAALMVANGEIDTGSIARLLETVDVEGDLRAARDRIAPLPATGLVLMDVRYKDLEFVLDQKAIRIASERSSDPFWSATMRVILGSALRSLVNETVIS